MDEINLPGAIVTEHVSFWKKWGSLFVLSLALAIVVIDTTLLNVSFATIVREFDTDIKSMQWVITAYTLMLAAFTITGGRIGDIYGRKKMFLVGAVIFGVGSLIASFSHSVGWLIIGESIIEGIGAALMMPATTSLLVSNFSGRDRAVAFGIWGGIAAAAAAIGPIIGGYLTSNFSWRWGFRINIVVVILLFLGSYLVKESRDEKAKTGLDEGGIILSAWGLFLVVFAVIESSSLGWWKAKEVFSVFGYSFPIQGGYSLVPLALLNGFIVLIGFIFYERWVEKKGRTPLVSLHLFNNRQFSFGVATTTVVFMGLSGLTFSLPIFFQSVRGLDAFQTGVALLPLSISLLIGAPLSAYLSKKIAPKYLIQGGTVIALLSFVIMYFTLNTSSTAASLILGLTVYGLGIGFVMAQISNVTLSAVPVRESGEASGVNNTLRTVGQTFGAAILGAVLLSTLGGNLREGIISSTVIPDQMKAQIVDAASTQTSRIEFGGGGVDVASGPLPEDVQKEIISISHQATVDGIKAGFEYAFFFALLGLLISMGLPNSKDLEYKEREIPAAGH